MAQYASTTSSTFEVGYKEDWSNMVMDISPLDTPVLSMMETETVDSLDYETYAVDIYAADGTIEIAREEGVINSDVTAKNTNKILMQNNCQIYFDTVKAADTANDSKHVGPVNELDRLGAELMAWHKKSYEKRVLTGYRRKAFDATTAGGYMMGMPGIIGRYADVCNSGTSYGSDSNNVITAIKNFDDSSSDSYNSESPADSQDLLDAVLNYLWGKGGDPNTLIVKGADKRAIARFASDGADRYFTSKDTVWNTVDVYRSPVGDHPIRVIAHRELAAHTDAADTVWDTTTGSSVAVETDVAFLFNPNKWKTCFLKNGAWTSLNLPVSGLMFERAHSAKVGLRCYNPGGDAVFTFSANAGFTNTLGLSTTAADYLAADA